MYRFTYENTKSHIASRLYYGLFEEDFDRPEEINFDLDLEPLHGGERFCLTKAQKKSCRSFRELTEKMNNESKHEFMVFLFCCCCCYLPLKSIIEKQY